MNILIFGTNWQTIIVELKCLKTVLKLTYTLETSARKH